MVDPRAGTPAEPKDLVDLDALAAAYYDRVPDPDDPAQQVSFGTSGHRGSSLDGSFNEAHILATTQAIVEYRAQAGIEGPLLLGRDTHALSLPAWQTALEVLIGNDVVTLVDTDDGFTPTPAVSHAILRLNGLSGRAEGGARAGRRHRRHAVAQPAARRRLQVQPAERRTGRLRHHRLGPGPGERAPPGRPPGGEARDDRPDARPGGDLRLPHPLRERPRRGPRHGGDRAGRRQDRRRPARWRVRRVLGPYR